MAKAVITEAYLEDIADAIREKLNTQSTYKPSEMAEAISSIVGGSINLETKTKSYTPTENIQTETITASSGYDGLQEVDVTVGAVSSTYVGSDISRNSSTNLTASGSIITAPAGYYENDATKSVESGTAGTPTASKGAVSNHTITVTPSVTNTTGYITGGTKTGTAVSVSASEVTSGNKSISSNGTDIDVTNYSTVSVNVASVSDSFVIPLTMDTSGSTYYSTIDTSQVTADQIISAYTSNKKIVAYSEEDSCYYPVKVYENGSNAYRAVVVDTFDLEADEAKSVYISLCDITTSITKNGTLSATYFVPSGNKSITSNGTNIDVANYATVSVNVPSQGATLQTKSKIYTPTESQQTDTITADTGYDGLSEVDVTVNAISSTYVGSGIARKSSSDLTASGATVTAPAGYYSSSATKTVASGTAGTPTATKGTVSNHAVSVTPSVTNTTGYITGSTKTGTAVTVSASELVSGSETKTANGTYDVTNLAELIVNVSGGGSSGLEYETGTWTPTADTSDAWVDLSKTYTTPPFFYQIWDDTGTYDNTQYVNYSIAYFQGDRIFNNGLRKGSSSSSGFQYGWCYGYYRGTSSSSLSSFTLSINYAKSNTSDSGANYPRHWATESKIRASTNYASRVWKSTRTYKYIAIWAPTGT